MQNDIASTPKNWVIAYWHHPPTARVPNNDGTVAKVEFFQGLNQIGEDLSVR